MTANGQESSAWGDGNGLLVKLNCGEVKAMQQFSKFTKDHRIGQLKPVSVMVCQWELNKALELGKSCRVPGCYPKLTDSVTKITLKVISRLEFS